MAEPARHGADSLDPDVGGHRLLKCSLQRLLAISIVDRDNDWRPTKRRQVTYEQPRTVGRRESGRREERGDHDAGASGSRVAHPLPDRPMLAGPAKRSCDCFEEPRLLSIPTRTSAGLVPTPIAGPQGVPLALASVPAHSPAPQRYPADRPRCMALLRRARTDAPACHWQCMPGRPVDRERACCTR